MRLRLFRSICLLLLPVAVITSFLAWSYERQVTLFPNRDYFLNDGYLISKLNQLSLDVPIVVGGDSRALMQVIPAELEAASGLPAVNIASSAGDLVQFRRAANRKQLLDQKRIFIISASLFQVSDGLNRFGYFSLEQFLSLSFIDRVLLFKSAYMGRMRSFLELLQVPRLNGEQPAAVPADDLQAKGARATNSQASCDFPRGPQGVMKHPWYLQLDIDHVRWRLTARTIRSLSREGSSDLFVIYNGPVSPSCRNQIQKTDVEKAEERYSQKLMKLAATTPNVVVFDFFTDPIPALADDMYFYDIQHLNAKGGAIFSRMLIERIRSDSKAQQWNKTHRPTLELEKR